jgi:hypothetical protein
MTMANRTVRGKRRDRDDWVAYGRAGAGRPKIGTSVSVTIPDAQMARLDEIAAARGVKRQDVLREAVSAYLTAADVPRA